MIVFDQLSFCDWRKGSTPNPHRNIRLVVMGVVLASRKGGSMFKVPIAAKYFFMEDPQNFR